MFGADNSPSIEWGKAQSTKGSLSGFGPSTCVYEVDERGGLTRRDDAGLVHTVLSVNRAWLREDRVGLLSSCSAEPGIGPGAEEVNAQPEVVRVNYLGRLASIILAGEARRR